MTTSSLPELGRRYDDDTLSDGGYSVVGESDGNSVERSDQHLIAPGGPKRLSRSVDALTRR